MKIRIDQTTLNAALKKASGSLSDKDLQPMLKNFKMTSELKDIDSKKVHRLKVQATDLSLSTIVILDGLVEVLEEGSITVPAKKILDYAASADDTKITIHSKDFRVFLSFGSNETELQGLDPDQYPEIEDWVEDSAITIDKDLFVMALERVTPAMTDDPTKSNFMMVKIDGGYIQATDSHRANVMKFPSSLVDFKISKGAVPELVKVLKLSGSKSFKINSTKSHNLFWVGGDIFSTRKVAETFPDIIQKLIEPCRKSNTQFLKIDKVTFRKVIDRVAIASDNDKCEVCLEMSPNKCTVTAKDKDGNTAKEQIPCSWDSGDARPKLFNYLFLDDIINVLKKKEVVIAFGPDSEKQRYPLFVEEDDFIGAILQRKPLS